MFLKGEDGLGHLLKVLDELERKLMICVQRDGQSHSPSGDTTVIPVIARRGRI